MMKPLTVLLMAGFLAACTSTPDEDARTAAAALPAVARDVPVDGLPPQRLAPGECGLFLWGMSAPRKFVFFSKGTSGEALVLIEDQPQRIEMTSAGGDVFGQFLTEMSFRDSAAGTDVAVTLNPGEPLEGGQRVASGSLLMRKADGWETVLPVTGVRACLPG